MESTKSVSFLAGCFSRCAVSKVDLKGRFVYVDSDIESLLGYSKDELFGRPLLDFVDEDSRRLLEHLLAQRNHYESFFESATLTFVNKSGDPVVANVIASLNFAGGNPVNFQLIINMQNSIRSVSKESRESFSWPDFYTRMMLLDYSHPWQELVNLLSLSGYADTVSVYEFEDGVLNPVSAAGRGGVEADIKSLPSIEDLHRQLIESGSEYSCLNEEQVRGAVESMGHAPDEFAAQFVTEDESLFLLRLVFAESLSEGQASLSVEQARLAIDHIKWRTNALCSARSDDPLHTLQFTVGFLESIGIGAALTDAEGQLVGFNPKMAELLKSKAVSGSYIDFCRRLSEFNPAEIEIAIKSYLTTALDADHPVNLLIPISFADDVRANLSVIRLSYEAEDLSACLIAQPLPDTKTGQKVSFLNDIDISNLVSLTRTQLEKINHSTQKLKGELSGRTNRGPARRASNLARDVTALEHIHSELAQALGLISEPEIASPVDLSSLLHGILLELNSTGLKSDIDCKCDGLPTVVLRRDQTATILRNLLGAIAALEAKEKVSLSITAQADFETCRIRVVEEQNQLAKLLLYQAFSSDLESHAEETGIDSAIAFKLSIAAALVRQSGGHIALEKGPGGLTELVATLPIRHD